MPRPSAEARALSARLAEIGVELAPQATEQLLGAARLALRAAGSAGVALELAEGWGVELVVDDEGTIEVDVFVIEPDEDPADDAGADDDEEPYA